MIQSVYSFVHDLVSRCYIIQVFCILGVLLNIFILTSNKMIPVYRNQTWTNLLVSGMYNCILSTTSCNILTILKYLWSYNGVRYLNIQWCPFLVFLSMQGLCLFWCHVHVLVPLYQVHPQILKSSNFQEFDPCYESTIAVLVILHVPLGHYIRMSPQIVHLWLQHSSLACINLYQYYKLQVTSNVTAKSTQKHMLQLTQIFFNF